MSAASSSFSRLLKVSYPSGPESIAFKGGMHSCDKQYRQGTRHAYIVVNMKNSMELAMDIKRPKIVGIVNITRDSFSDGGRYLD
ncbi:MAG: hypothetical protein P8Y67_09135, partial [Alphaproteobacteria bacterium]